MTKRGWTRTVVLLTAMAPAAMTAPARVGAATVGATGALTPVGTARCHAVVRI